ncbi:hypothetical protein [Nocardioides sp.]|uniref:hypothetical protein n=1 Tax=Nocardioides sp. TaxID=35761 RepID=UPI0027291A7D|nr:hypothetical protein [Nocardioides sp.]MDO9455596.1 hypothetical protein [Nocardioides sp.]
MNLRPLLLLPLLAPALVTSYVDSAQAVGPTCAGRPATIVGHGQGGLVGTAGDDVMITGGAQVVGTRGGDDLVCITARGDRLTTQISTGAGDDRVLNRAGRVVQVDLGSGSDTYVGGSRKDDVFAGDDSEGSRDDRDVISTGGGPDSVSSGAPYGGLVDDIDLGPGRDDLYLANRVAGEGARFVGGRDSDQLLLYGPLPDQVVPGPPDPLGGAEWLVTNTAATGTATADGVPTLSWDGFERFAMNAEVGSFRFIGSARNETVESYKIDGAQMGGGDDVVLTHVAPLPGTFDGGPGRDFADIGVCQGTATADLARDTYRCTTDEATSASTIPGVEDLAVIAQRAVLRGSDAPEKLVAEACGGSVRGFGGDDRLRSRTFPQEGGWPLPDCPVPVNGVVALTGGPGDDTLYGRWGPDRLIGGTGDDRAYGANGRDTCRAELELGCELS